MLPSATKYPTMDTTYCILPKNLQEATGPDQDTHQAADVELPWLQNLAVYSACFDPPNLQSTGQFLTHTKYPVLWRSIYILPLTAELVHY